MSGPNLIDIAQSLPAIRAVIDRVIAYIRAHSPDIAAADEALISEALAQALEGVDVAGLAESLMSVAKVLKEGRGISGGGADASLA